MTLITSHPTDEQLALFYYQELEPASVPGIEAHLFGCENCRSRLKRWDEVSEQMGSQLKENQERSHTFPTSLSPYPANSGATHLKKATPQNSSHRGWPQSLIGLTASTLLVIGGFVWGSMYRPDSSTFAAELKTELTQIKQTIAVQQEQNQLGEIESQIETLKAEIQKSRNLRNNSIAKKDLEKLYRQLVAVATQTEELKENISSLAINAQAEIEKNRMAVAQLFVKSDIKNHTFETP